MKCDFLTYKGWSGDYCLKKEDYISKDTVNTYCDNSLKYKDCPIYRDSSSGGGCYLTTACVEYKGFADDCYELTTLRNFRDAYLKEQAGGKEEVEDYYENAPRIVRKIDSNEGAAEVYEGIFESVIKPCVKYIEEGKNEEAHNLYKEMVNRLKQLYLD